MIGSGAWVSEEQQARYAGYHRVIGMITWLLIALVSLYISLLPTAPEIRLLLAGCSLALLCYRVASGKLLPDGETKGVLELVPLFLFVVTLCWYTGKTHSPFLSFLYLILMTAALTLGRRVSYLLAACSLVAYIFLASWQYPALGADFASRTIQLFPFMLIAHLGALLSREAENARVEVERLSLTDDLTELNNMRSFEALALQQERLSRRYEKSYAICMLDSDNLKQVNDRFGHLAGTELIKWTARIIRDNTRECDIAARFGGDEFIILYDGHDKEQILPAVERIVRALAANPFSFAGERIDCTISAGIASFPEDGPDLRSVIMRADEAMYVSKRLGKDRVTLYNAERGDGMASKGMGRTVLPHRPVS